jgi:hypothetical protein
VIKQNAAVGVDQQQRARLVIDGFVERDAELDGRNSKPTFL